ncbi:hypothetical protein OIDMADRAFT_18434 [Oidiodendron maius Zn]|uniref:Uncharacterized protein n=1 Tax=Oidiodendron maius (strain Zn) TaxID=913774 RepID=A0A0C3H3J7_OIDMZ|nr:hypothetical protein OIDMADRAFT_18434 [Oidiodendron maius Zn]
MQFRYTQLTLVAVMAVFVQAGPAESLLPRGCSPGTYACYTTPGKDEILVCDTSGDWEVAAICGGAGCCDASSGVPHCDC